MDSIEIREMVFADLEQVTRLADQLGYPFELEVIQRRFQELSKNQTHKFYVAADSSQVVGWILINQEVATLLSDSRAQVSALVADEKYRGKGIGKRLLEKAEAWAIENKHFLVRLTSNLIRTEAHQFYQKQGYAIKKSWYLFTKSL